MPLLLTLTLPLPLPLPLPWLPRVLPHMEWLMLALQQVALGSRSSSIWNYHFRSYVLTIYVRLY